MTRARFAVVLLWVVHGAMAAEPPERAALLQKAQKAERGLELGQAYHLVKEALELGGASPSETAALYGELGRLAADLKDADAAELWFERALELRPEFEIPPDGSPRQKPPYEAARARLHGLSLDTALATRNTPEGTVLLTLSLKSDPASLVASAALTYRCLGETHDTPLARGEGFVAQLPCRSASGNYWVRLFDASGNIVRELGGSDAPLVFLGTGATGETPPKVAVAAPSPAPVPERPFLRRPWLYGAVGVAAAGVAVGFGLRFRNEQSQLAALNAAPAGHPYSQAQSLDAARRRDQIIAWSTGATAGICLSAAVLVGVF